MASFQELLGIAEAALNLFTQTVTDITAIRDALSQDDLADLDALLNRAMAKSEEVGAALDAAAAEAAKGGQG